MKRSFTLITRLLCLIFFPGLLFAQQKKDLSILLKTGKFIPAENAMTITKSADVFRQSLFSNKYYVTIQFNSLPDEAAKARLSAAGIQLIDYIPNLAFTAALPVTINPQDLRSFDIRSVFQFDATQKAMPALLSGPVPPYAIKEPGYADINVLTYEKMNSVEVTGAFYDIGAVVITETPVFRTFTVRIAVQNISRLAALAFVQWLEFINPPNQPDNLPGRTLHRASVLNDGLRNLKGDGVNVGIWDGGAISPHIDFTPTGRVTQVQSIGSFDSHSTHCSGTILGRGIINPTARGMAPNAKLFSYDYNGDIQAEMAAAIPANNLMVSSHSYNDGLGVQCGLAGANSAYSLVSRNTDVNLNNNPSHLHVHSAGNNQTSCANGWTTITGAGKSAKNNLVVAAISATEAMTTFSSFGPVADGRIKPEISAMGLNVFSTYLPLNTYGTISGTSMSTPGAAGTVTLLVQAYEQLNGGTPPPSSLIKNIVCNTAKDLGNPGPDYKYGFGCINALQAVRILEQNRYVVNNISTTQVNNTTITVPAGAARLRVMITWNDPAAAANANPALVNDLDLSVINGATTTLPWKLDPANPANNATKGTDNISNIEQVTIDNPPAGNYTISVNGTAVPMGPQQYSLTWNIDVPYIEVIYPNGPESFNPGSSEYITWDNAGITGNQTVEYSLNNGTNWTTLSTTVPAATTRLSWNVPVANTSTALVRISSAAITDVSDLNFKILGTTLGFASTAVAGCNSGTVSFVWNAVTNATNYDIYKLDDVTGNFVILAADVTGTSYTATGLPPGASMWFTIRAKNNTTGAISERAIAINATVSSGGGGLGLIGSITGQTNICGTPTNVNYSIPAVTGATTYTWTAPPGAIITSGQGTSSINISYPAGSTNGNVAVFAGNAVCQTSTSTLAITLGSAAVSAPITGGNQTVTLCPGDPVPTLTPAATVPGGQTVVWYTAATGGSIIVNPALSFIGTATFYAAALDNATSCQSALRTAVTLTINATQPAAITAGGPLSFCQGGSVVLTANSGSSYLWSNGATSQSITVNATGNYTVSVTQSAGCTDVSPVTTVTVNPLPVSNISASGATTFCEGINVILTASAGNSWLWSNGATTQSITVSTTGNYSVTVTGAGGCTALSATTPVTVNVNPPAIINANGVTTFCNGSNVILTASSGNSYLWNNGATTQSITVNASGNFTVAVTQNGGCVSNSTTTSVTVNPNPAADISANGATSFCQGDDVTLTASAGNSWLWSNGATSQSVTVIAAGNYSVTVTDANGCSTASLATAVTVSPKPVVSITASPYIRLYPGLITTLTANTNPPGTYTYTWFRNGIIIAGATTASIPNIDLDDLGSYTVTVTNTTGQACSNTSTAVEISDSATTRMFIYPSPNRGQFKISYYSPGTNAQNLLRIYDSKGSFVYTHNYVLSSPYQTMDVDMRRNSRGIYRVVLFDNKSGKRLAVGSVVLE
ncbi:MAG: S8 family serine peptidase [Ferruginibacter sp.]